MESDCDSDKEREEIIEELVTFELLARENPCGMPSGVLQTILVGIKTLFGHHFVKGASREQVARYYHRDVRTLTRWKDTYKDFPKARHDGHLEVSYDWLEVVRFKRKHKELWKEG